MYIFISFLLQCHDSFSQIDTITKLVHLDTCKRIIYELTLIKIMDRKANFRRTVLTMESDKYDQLKCHKYPNLTTEIFQIGSRIKSHRDVKSYDFCLKEI